VREKPLQIFRGQSGGRVRREGFHGRLSTSTFPISFTNARRGTSRRGRWPRKGALEFNAPAFLAAHHQNKPRFRAWRIANKGISIIWTGTNTGGLVLVPVRAMEIICFSPLYFSVSFAAWVSNASPMSMRRRSAKSMS
jgi:hypothetical protein